MLRGNYLLKKYIIIIYVFFVVPFLVLGEELDGGETREVLPVLNIFHEVGWNILRTAAHDYGLDFAASGLLTYGMVEGGFDWWYYKKIYGNGGLRGWGVAAEYAGAIVPIASPLLAYGIGRLVTNDIKLQVLGAALAQSALINSAYQTTIKVFAGRQQMCNGALSDSDSNEYSPLSGDYSKMFRWGFLRGRSDSDPFGFVDGWPSAHTANAVSAAAIISEIYDDNIWLSVGAYAYAALIGVGMSFYDHWASDIIGGALIGFAVGKTVGKSFKKLLAPEGRPEKISFYITPNSIGIIVKR
jgi:membrane-associated phospholipid phosphatase